MFISWTGIINGQMTGGDIVLKQPLSRSNGRRVLGRIWTVRWRSDSGICLVTFRLTFIEECLV